ncbi:MAG: hypothetical protein RSE46_12795, partial [Janthinobacterium sp.]
LVCAVNPEHQHFAGQGCAACARDKVIVAAGQASAQAQQMQLQQQSLPPQRSARGAHHTTPGQAPVAIPISGSGGITGKGWAVVV